MQPGEGGKSHPEEQIAKVYRIKRRGGTWPLGGLLERNVPGGGGGALGKKCNP